MKIIYSLTLALLMLISIAAVAVEPSEMLDDPALEARAREISAGLRCVVCQNQSIDESNAELARDLRILVRERLTNGDSDQDVLDYVVSRYGEFVLLSPPIKGSTYALWFGPLIFVVIGVFAVGMIFRRKKSNEADPLDTIDILSKDELSRLEKLLGESDEDKKPS